MALSLVQQELHRVNGLMSLIPFESPSSSSSSSSSSSHRETYLLQSFAIEEDRKFKVKEESEESKGIWRLLVSELEGTEAKEGYGEWEAIVSTNDIIELVNTHR